MPTLRRIVRDSFGFATCCAWLPGVVQCPLSNSSTIAFGSWLSCENHVPLRCSMVCCGGLAWLAVGGGHLPRGQRGSVNRALNKVSVSCKERVVLWPDVFMYFELDRC